MSLRALKCSILHGDVYSDEKDQERKIACVGRQVMNLIGRKEICIYNVREQISLHPGISIGIKQATTSRMSYLSPAADLVATFKARGASQDFLIDILIVAIQSCSMMNLVQILLPFLQDKDKPLPEEFQQYYWDQCNELKIQRNSGRPERFRTLPNHQWPQNKTEMQIGRQAVSEILEDLIQLPKKRDISPEDFHKQACAKAQKNRGLGKFRSSMVVQALVLSGLAGDDKRVLEQGRYMEIIIPRSSSEKRTVPYRVCQERRINTDTALIKLAKKLKLYCDRETSLGEAEACFCEPFRSNGVPKEIYYRGQHMRDILEDEILIGPPVS